MSSTEEFTSAPAAAPAAVCTNSEGCRKAAAGEAIEWYPGAGEYCPECGEVLTRRDAPAGQPGAATPSVPPSSSPGAPRPSAGGATATLAPAEVIPDSTAGLTELLRRPPPVRRPAPRKSPLVRALVFAALLCAAAIAAFTYFGRRSTATDSARPVAISVCPVSSAQQVVTDLVRAYAAKSGLPLSRFTVRGGKSCDVRFTTASATSDAVIARDGIVAIVNPLNPIPRISELQLRGIFSGAIRDWSALGAPAGPIVALIPNDVTDEATAIASSLFYGVRIDRALDRPATSAEVTRMVTGADRRSRGAIGLVAFSAAVPAKVIPLAYLPPPSVLTIASGRYPYTVTIGVERGSTSSDPAAAGLVEFARSNDGAEIVARDGLIGRGSI